VLEVVVEVPPPVVGVVFAGVVVAGVVVAGVVAAEELVELVTEPLSVDPAAPVPEVARSNSSSSPSRSRCRSCCW